MLLVEDRQLRERFKAGEREAMATVFDHYADGLVEYLRLGFTFKSGEQTMRFAGVKSRHDLHDIVTETFRAAFEQKARLAYSGLAAYKGYLRTIARNLVIDQLRAKSSKWVSLEAHPQLDVADAGDSPERSAVKKELSQLMRAFLAQRSRPEQQFISLRFEEGLSQRDVAQRMAQSRRWVRTTEEHLRAKLARHLAHSGYV